MGQYRRVGVRGARAILLLALLVLGCGRTAVELPPPGAAAPDPDAELHRVIFIHGFRGSPRLFDRFYLAGLKLLPPNCELYIVRGLPGFMGAMEKEGPDKVVAAFERWLDDNGITRENLHLVAHSMGGLMARRFTARHPEAVRQVFLLGSPNGGVQMLNGLNPAGWCTPAGIDAFNADTPPTPGVRWYLLAGDRYRDGTGGALLESFPNDGVVSVESVLRFAELCGDSVAVESAVMPLSHPNWNWGENLLESPRSIRWVLERIRADVDG